MNIVFVSRGALTNARVSSSRQKSWHHPKLHKKRFDLHSDVILRTTDGKSAFQVSTTDLTFLFTQPFELK